jgi:two-component system, OmpR family, phosphate regulon sensor histidine kinase PhoR
LLRYANWRLALFYAALLTATIAALAIFTRVTLCGTMQTCWQSGIWLIVAAGLAATILLTLYASARRNQALGEMTDAVRGAATAESSTRILVHSSDYESELARAISDMMDRFRSELRQYAGVNKQLSIVFQNMADGVLITDDLGRVLLMNPAASRMLNYDMAIAQGRSYAEVVRHHGLIDLWQQCRLEGEEAVAAVEIGRNLFLQAVATPFQENGVRGSLIILQDLTQLRFLQTVRRDFISNISHELRTPLASIRAIVETLQDGALEEEALALRFLDRADSELDTLTQMVEELLELARIESGEVPLRLAESEVLELVEVPLARIRQQAERDEITVEVDIPLDLPTVMADAERMRRVVSNLLHNAVKFTDAGGTIRVAAYVDSDADAEVVILVNDNGVGIAAPDLERIFERFYKSDRARTRSQSGTGLGLAITKHLVEAHGGRIWVESKKGKGSTFFFTLPTISAPVNQTLTRP